MAKPSTFNKMFLYPSGDGGHNANGYFGKSRIINEMFQFTPSKLSRERGWMNVTAKIREVTSTNRKGEKKSYGVVDGNDGAKYFIFPAIFTDKMTGKKLEGYTVTIKLPKLKRTNRKEKSKY